MIIDDVDVGHSAVCYRGDLRRSMKDRGQGPQSKAVRSAAASPSAGLGLVLRVLVQTLLDADIALF